MPYDEDKHTTTQTYTGSGQVATKAIQGRALDPDAKLAVEEKMRTTDLGALARAAAAKKAESAKAAQKKALSEDKKEK